MLKSFSLEVKDNDPMQVASEIKESMHKIQVYVMKHDLPVTAFVKSLYSIHSNYLESLQASNKFKYLIFDTMVENIADKEKSFRKKSGKPTRRSLCFVQKAKNHPKDPSKGDSSKRG